MEEGRRKLRLRRRSAGRGARVLVAARAHRLVTASTGFRFHLHTGARKADETSTFEQRNKFGATDT